MDCAKVKQKLKTIVFGRHLHCFGSIGSTNSYILSLAREGAPEGTVVCAEFQESGKGRRQRSWHSPSGQNLLCSILLRPQREILEVQKITLAAANILAATIEKYIQLKNFENIKINVKWPNDLLINGKKISGILAESILQGKKIEALALGFGVNLNTPVHEMATDIQGIATSLIDHTGEAIERERFLSLFLDEFEKNYLKLERTNYTNVIKQWKKRCLQINQPIQVINADGSKKALFHDISDAGYLIYQNPDGTLEELVAGEIKKV